MKSQIIGGANEILLMEYNPGEICHIKNPSQRISCTLPVRNQGWCAGHGLPPLRGQVSSIPMCLV